MGRTTESRRRLRWLNERSGAAAHRQRCEFPRSENAAGPSLFHKSGPPVADGRAPAPRYGAAEQRGDGAATRCDRPVASGADRGRSGAGGAPGANVSTVGCVRGAARGTFRPPALVAEPKAGSTGAVTRAAPQQPLPAPIVAGRSRACAIPAAFPVLAKECSASASACSHSPAMDRTCVPLVASQRIDPGRLAIAAVSKIRQRGFPRPDERRPNGSSTGSGRGSSASELPATPIAIRATRSSAKSSGGRSSARSTATVGAVRAARRCSRACRPSSRGRQACPPCVASICCRRSAARCRPASSASTPQASSTRASTCSAGVNACPLARNCA
ncbi:MAG: hypothetical protein AW08_03933 [Candidatus Accumulibacter adjunctus]|uniref:Uncharacterized protein n=1 Tax=Candidatus Accumulibacter adjunctus TaxID=1454001 RepID=A0A011NGI7_9PROT|nr:MAG: hypothetical protein AW08_03933 [Candidatus Accumulibacter adjunctus]